MKGATPMSKDKIKDTGKKTKIGGQALIEGIMMRGVSNAAMAVRMKDGGIDVEEWELKARKWYEKTPFIRGSINFVTQLMDGYKCMMKSAEKSGMLDDDGSEEPSKFEKWLDDKFGDKLTNAIMTVAMVIGVALAVVLFLFVPSYLFSLIETAAGDVDISMWKSTFEGVLKLILFVAYMAVVAQMKDIKRTYEYHGAEHKTIACYEAGKPLTVENVRPMCRFHPRCGTSFIIITLLVSILFYSIVPIEPGQWFSIENNALAVMLRVVIKLAFLPLVVGIAYELIRLAGKYTNVFTRVLSAPGLWMQRLTTREPDDSQIEVAIAAMKPCLPKEGENDNW